MNGWQFLDAQIARLGRFVDRIFDIEIRAWIAIGAYGLVVYSLSLIHNNPAFAKLEELIIQALVIQVFVTGVVGFYFAASSAGTEAFKKLSQSAGDAMAQQTANSATAGSVSADKKDVQIDANTVTINVPAPYDLTKLYAAGDVVADPADAKAHYRALVGNQGSELSNTAVWEPLPPEGSAQ